MNIKEGTRDKGQGFDRAQPSGATVRSGFAMVEAMLASVIMAVAVAAALSTACSTATYQLRSAQHARAGALADDLVSEIMYQAYQDPVYPTTTLGPDTGERTTLRADWNDCDDYNGWTESPLQNKDGSAIANTTGWTRSVVVNWVTVADPTVTSTTETGVKRIVVTVTNGSGAKVVRTFLRTNHS
jgi:MSHA pilin protein MshD